MTRDTRDTRDTLIFRGCTGCHGCTGLLVGAGILLGSAVIAWTLDFAGVWQGRIGIRGGGLAKNRAYGIVSGSEAVLGFLLGFAPVMTRK